MLALRFEACSALALNNRSESRNDILSPKPSSREKWGVDADRHAEGGIFAQVADGQNVSKKQAQDLLVGMVETMTEHLKRGDRIRISGLGTLEVRHREARTGRNPATGEMMQIAASKKVAFRPAKELKEAV
jgi:DNA-binding protein HU-beta